MSIGDRCEGNASPARGGVFNSVAVFRSVEPRLVGENRALLLEERNEPTELAKDTARC